MDTTALLQRPVWAEGVLLGQQHFQCWDRYLEAAQAFRLSVATPHAFGLLSLAIEGGPLEQGVFRLQACQALLPDRRLVAHGHADPLELDLGGLPAQGGVIYLTLPRNDRVRDLPGYRETGGGAAWRPRFAELVDHHDEQREREVMLASPELALGVQPPSGARVGVAVARVVPGESAGFRLDPDFLPVACRLDAADGWQALLGRVTARVENRCARLREEQGAAGRVGAFEPGEVARLLLRQSLEPAAGALRSLRANPGSHPWQLYDTLARLIAALCALVEAASPAEMVPVYDHQRPEAVFAELESALGHLLDQAMPRQTRGIRLVRESEAVLVAEGGEDPLAEGWTFFLAARRDAAPDAGWIERLPADLRIGTREALERLVAAGAAGVRLSHCPRPPGQLPVKSGYEYFRLEPAGNHWDQVRREQTLAVYRPSELADLQLEMVALCEEVSP
ncbi:type VI secretion system baseplate subunit TssK [Halorhodospira halophila]|uniref:type VI secretion system baseplate subunit TssK n=1 Tax=Halorhodospira halophila TaxID=1053 RepID=UPI0019113B27|nr:type VI secretion system baseplate subunit TssK [Halorhodospira halophila]